MSDFAVATARLLSFLAQHEISFKIASRLGAIFQNSPSRKIAIARVKLSCWGSWETFHPGARNGLNFKNTSSSVRLHPSSNPARFICESFIWFSMPVSLRNCFFLWVFRLVE